MAYELHYWPDIQGRGEFVRLALEYAGAPYVDVAREPGGKDRRFEGLATGDRPPFAPPFLKDGDLVIGQTAAILLHLGPKLGLAPADEADRLWAHQVQLTIADLVGEAHDTHHPIAVGLYYEDQKAEALRRAAEFRRERIPKFLGWLERILAAEHARDAWLAGGSISYADLSAFQVVEGLRYAFPKTTAGVLGKSPRLTRLVERVAALPRIRAYLDSPRRIAFNDEGVFRRYPELDP
jgi:glutathione S-transferase